MVAFGNALNAGADQKRLQQLSLNVTYACRNELAESSGRTQLAAQPINHLTSSCTKSPCVRHFLECRPRTRLWPVKIFLQGRA